MAWRFKWRNRKRWHCAGSVMDSANSRRWRRGNCVRMSSRRCGRQQKGARQAAAATATLGGDRCGALAQLEVVKRRARQHRFFCPTRDIFTKPPTLCSGLDDVYLLRTGMIDQVFQPSRPMADIGRRAASASPARSMMLLRESDDHMHEHATRERLVLHATSAIDKTKMVPSGFRVWCDDRHPFNPCVDGRVLPLAGAREHVRFGSLGRLWDVVRKQKRYGIGPGHASTDHVAGATVESKNNM